MSRQLPPLPSATDDARPGAPWSWRGRRAGVVNERRPRHVGSWGLAIALSGTAATLLAACSGPSPDPVTPLAIRSRGCRLTFVGSTGFAVGDGLVVTVAHSMRGAREQFVGDEPAELVAIDVRSDIAVLRVATDPASAVDFADPVVDDPVSIPVFHDKVALTLHGTISRTPTIRFDVPTDDRSYDRGGMFIDDLDVVKGDSGAPVIGSDGRVVGMVFATSRTTSRAYAVNTDEIRDVLDRVSATPVDSLSCSGPIGE